MPSGSRKLGTEAGRAAFSSEKKVVELLKNSVAADGLAVIDETSNWAFTYRVPDGGLSDLDAGVKRTLAPG